VYASYYEIYNEQIFDLLEEIPTDLPSDVVYRRKVLKMKENRDGRVFVQGLKRVCITSAAEGQAVLERGQRNRRVGDTRIHADSSRSHSIFTLDLLRRDPSAAGAAAAAPITERDFERVRGCAGMCCGVVWVYIFIGADSLAFVCLSVHICLSAC